LAQSIIAKAERAKAHSAFYLYDMTLDENEMVDNKTKESLADTYVIRLMGSERGTIVSPILSISFGEK